ncbi:M10 family metallopeptidase C-terminal domain-containing protein [Terasakiella sp. A23]|uniref:M10 family metallopeptidase C-terminal domain-containing protein n=1 Tax=Terasakiella sp. FCG-A23 TaxID=3080561 RepID=UPI002954C0DC|nr:M10 family metallopeptidase C-terminal domain-containing protein [Terasakiella sp. A23]MDV7341050.1 M10 family metallopeptidase C-terminal domain-containing protein [Terasakiella sp. A23]
MPAPEPEGEGNAELDALMQDIFETALEEGATPEEAAALAREAAQSFGLPSFNQGSFQPGPTFSSQEPTFTTFERNDPPSSTFSPTSTFNASTQSDPSLIGPKFDRFFIQGLGNDPADESQSEGTGTGDGPGDNTELDGFLPPKPSISFDLAPPPAPKREPTTITENTQPPPQTIPPADGGTTTTPGQSVTATTSNAILTGGSGDDTLTGGTTTDILIGGAGTDNLSGGDGNDTYHLSAGFGSDTITDSAGTGDKISGFSIQNLSNAEQSGNDLILSFYTGDTVTIKDHFVNGGEVEILISGSDDYGLSGQTTGVKGQILAGTAATNNTLTGAASDDVIFGSSGDDLLTGGVGNDSLFGGAGSDTAIFTGNQADYTVTKTDQGFQISDSVGSRDGVTQVKDIENLQFADATVTASAAVATPNRVTGLMFDDSYARWNADTSVGNSVSLTYSFMDALPSYYTTPGEIVNFTTMSSAQQTAVRTVLGQFSEITNLTFTEVADTGNGGILRFAGSEQTSSAGFAFSPSVDYTLNGVNITANEKGGDVFIANNQTSNDTLTNGSHGFYTLIHEIGHATGLAHPFDGTNRLTGTDDSQQYTVMSYTSHPKAQVIDVTGDASSYSYTVHDWYPETLMTYDIAALQHLYGANTSTNTGDDTYSFNPDDRVFKSIWDAAGTDTIDASNFSRDSIIDLTPGNYSSIGIYNPVGSQLPSFYDQAPQPTYSAEDNVGIAFDVIIENATGGSGADQLIGNFADNTLTGGAGNDTLTGGLGNDHLIGGADNDSYVFATASGSDTITDSAGTSDQISGFTVDNLSNATRSGNDLILSFKTGDRITVKNHFTTGNEVEILLSGSDSYGLAGQTSGVVGQIISDPSTGSDLLAGGAGNDYIFGDEGADTLQGGAGSDQLIGGAGNDIFYFETSDGSDTIADFSKGNDQIHIKGSDFGITEVIFEAITATYDGTNATSATANVIRDSSNNLYVDTNGQSTGGYSLVANVSHEVAVDDSDITLV